MIALGLGYSADARVQCRSRSRIRKPGPTAVGLIGSYLTFVVAAFFLPSSVVHADPVDPGEGVTFAQVDYLFDGAPTPNSGTGEVEIDIAALVTALPTIPSGYLNVATADGWVVQNLPVDLSFGYPGISTAFFLAPTSGVDVTSFNASVDYSPTPSLFFSGPMQSFSVGDVSYNAQGKGEFPAAGVTLPPAPNQIAFQVGGATNLIFQPGHPNVQSAEDQCLPAAVANSFDWLRTTYGVPVPHANIPGLLGAPPNSLVAQLDVEMRRPARCRADGDSTCELAGLQGKMQYLARHNLAGYLKLQHQGSCTCRATQFTGANNESVTVGGTTVTSKGAGATATSAFILSELQAGEDVEFGFAFTPPPGGHMVEAVGGGTILGIPFILHKSDHLQTDEDPDDTRGVGLFPDFSFLQDTPGGAKLIYNRKEGIIDTVYTESPAIRDHFQCYEVERQLFARITGVSVNDRFGNSTVDVIRPKRICNPANKNGENPMAPSHPDHLTGYTIKQTTPFARVRGLTVINQFGTITLDVARPDYLMVPSAKSLTGSPTLPANFSVNHAKCYRVVRAKTRVPGLTVQDQFGTFQLDVRRPMRLCVPADKNASGIPNPPNPLMCYKAVPSPGSLRFRGPEDSVFVNNQFGAQTFVVNHQRELCVPSALVGPSPVSTTTPIPTSTSGRCALTPTPTATPTQTPTVTPTPP